MKIHRLKINHIETETKFFPPRGVTSWFLRFAYSRKGNSTHETVSRKFTRSEKFTNSEVCHEQLKVTKSADLYDFQKKMSRKAEKSRKVSVTNRVTDRNSKNTNRLRKVTKISKNHEHFHLVNMQISKTMDIALGIH